MVRESFIFCQRGPGMSMAASEGGMSHRLWGASKVQAGISMMILGVWVLITRYFEWDSQKDHSDAESNPSSLSRRINSYSNQRHSSLDNCFSSEKLVSQEDPSLPDNTHQDESMHDSEKTNFQPRSTPSQLKNISSKDPASAFIFPLGLRLQGIEKPMIVKPHG